VPTAKPTEFLLWGPAGLYVQTRNERGTFCSYAGPISLDEAKRFAARVECMLYVIKPVELEVAV